MILLFSFHGALTLVSSSRMEEVLHWDTAHPKFPVSEDEKHVTMRGSPLRLCVHLKRLKTNPYVLVQRATPLCPTAGW